MKKLITTLLFIAAYTSTFGQDTSTNTHNKENFYLRAGAGYALPSSGMVTYTALFNYEVKRGDYSTGLNETIGGGYMINSHIGVELNAASYSGGNRCSRVIYEPDNTSPYNAPISYNYQYNLQQLSLLMPGLVVQTGEKRWTLYNRLAAVLPVIDKCSYDETITDGLYLLQQTYELKNRFTLGFSGAVGVRYRISRRAQFWAEASYLSLMPYAKTSTLTSSAQNTIDNLSNYNGQTTTAFSKSGTYNYSGLIYTNQPLYTNSFSNKCIQAGVAINLGNMRPEQPMQRGGGHFYFKGGLSYASVMPGINNTQYSIDQKIYYNYNGSSGNIVFSTKPMSFSAGPSGILGAGYMFGNHIGAELDGNIGLINKKYSNTEEEYEPGANVVDDIYKSTIYAKMPVLLSPCLVLQTGGKTINIYGRAGIALPASNKLIINENELGYMDTVSRSEQITTRFTIGYTGAAGIQYKLTTHLALWGEVSVLSFSPGTKQLTETSYTGSGIGAITQQTITYTKSGTLYIPSATGSPAYTPTNQQPSTQLPYNNIGVQGGVAFHL